jgi:recombinational DNA repair protein RecR
MFFIFHRSFTLKRHINNVHSGLRAEEGPRSLTCHICNKTMSKYKHLADHIRKTHSEKKECKICGNFFSQNFTLKRHMRVVHQGYDETKEPIITLETEDSLPMET